MCGIMVNCDRHGKCSGASQHNRWAIETQWTLEEFIREPAEHEELAQYFTTLQDGVIARAVRANGIVDVHRLTYRPQWLDWPVIVGHCCAWLACMDMAFHAAHPTALALAIPVSFHLQQLQQHENHRH
jgi:hypothetical protein